MKYTKLHLTGDPEDIPIDSDYLATFAGKNMIDFVNDCVEYFREYPGYITALTSLVNMFLVSPVKFGYYMATGPFKYNSDRFLKRLEEISKDAVDRSLKERIRDISD